MRPMEMASVFGWERTDVSRECSDAESLSRTKENRLTESMKGVIRHTPEINEVYFDASVERLWSFVGESELLAKWLSGPVDKLEPVGGTPSRSSTDTDASTDRPDIAACQRAWMRAGRPFQVARATDVLCKPSLSVGVARKAVGFPAGGIGIVIPELGTEPLAGD